MLDSVLHGLRLARCKRGNLADTNLSKNHPLSTKHGVTLFEGDNAHEGRVTSTEFKYVSFVHRSSIEAPQKYKALQSCAAQEVFHECSCSAKSYHTSHQVNLLLS